MPVDFLRRGLLPERERLPAVFKRMRDVFGQRKQLRQLRFRLCLDAVHLHAERLFGYGISDVLFRGRRRDKRGNRPQRRIVRVLFDTEYSDIRMHERQRLRMEQILFGKRRLRVDIVQRHMQGNQQSPMRDQIGLLHGQFRLSVQSNLFRQHLC